jgi:hypothetical protein
MNKDFILRMFKNNLSFSQRELSNFAAKFDNTFQLWDVHLNSGKPAK